MDPKYVIYQDGVISVGLFTQDSAPDEKDLLNVGIRWLSPESYRRPDGQVQETTNVMGGETQWFLLPHSFGCAVCKRLVEQRVADAGLNRYFDEPSFKRMVSWLI